MKKDKFLYIFDFDETLFFNKNLTFKSYNFAFKKLNINLNKNSFFKNFGLPRNLFINKIAEKNLSKSLSEKIIKIKNNYFFNNLSKNIENEVLINLVKNLSKSNNNYVAIASSASKANIKKQIKFFNLQNYFNIILCREDVKKTKPDDEVLRKLQKKFKIKKKNIIFFDDSKFGYLAAKKFKIKFLKFDNFN